MKKIILVFACLLLSSLLFAEAEKINNNDITQLNLLRQTFPMSQSTVVATVNGEAINKGQLMNELWMSGANKTLEVLINQKIIEQGMAKEGIVITSKEINDEVDKLLKQYKVPSIADFLQGVGLSKDDFYREIKIQLGLNKYADTHFKMDPAKLANYMYPSHILIKFDPSIQNEVEREEVCKKKIDEIYAKVKAGEDFAKLASEYSEDGSKANGGSLGWVDANVNYVPEFKAAMLKLKVGEISEPVKTQFGYHIIKMVARGDTASPAEIKSLIDKEKAKQQPLIINQWYDSLKKEAKIENYLVPVVKETPKPEVKEAPKDAPKPEVKDAPKPEVKDAPKDAPKPADKK